ncbi:unnamed protein product [Leuciscus chuanchicus]
MSKSFVSSGVMFDAALVGSIRESICSNRSSRHRQNTSSSSVSSMSSSVFSTTNRKKAEARLTGGGPPPPSPLTPSEELALSLNKGRPVVAGIPGGTSSHTPCTTNTDRGIVLLDPTERTQSVTADEDDDEETTSAVTEVDNAGRSTEYIPGDLPTDEGPSTSTHNLTGNYGGRPGTCKGFLTQVSLIFELQPATFASERAKIAYIISLLCDHALDWASTLWRQQSPICSDLKVFTETIQQVFDHPVSGREAARRLLDLHQGHQSVADYAIEFRTLASESKWDSEALISTFYHGLSEGVKDELASRDWSTSLEELITLADRIDNHIRERRRERCAARDMPMLSSPKVPEVSHLTQQTEEEPMQLAATPSGEDHSTSSLGYISYSNDRLSNSLKTLCFSASPHRYWIHWKHHLPQSYSQTPTENLGTQLRRGCIRYCTPTVMLHIGEYPTSRENLLSGSGSFHCRYHLRMPVDEPTFPSGKLEYRRDYSVE